MKTLKASLYSLACLVALSSCVKENTGTSSKKNRDPKVETIEVCVSATLDLDFKAAAIAEDKDLAEFLSPAWEWAKGDSVSLVYSYDGVEGVVVSSSIAIDPSDKSTATFSFKNVPSVAKVVRLEVGSEGVMGQIVSEKDPISKSSVYEIAPVEAEAGETEIDGVKFKNCCSYFDVYVPSIRVQDSSVDVDIISLVGQWINGCDTLAKTISLNYEKSPRTDHYLFAVNNEAWNVRFDITAQSSTSKLVDIEDMDGVSKFMTVRDPADLSEVITVSVEAFLDPTFKAATASSYPEASALCSWNKDGSIQLAYSAGAFKGYDTPSSVTIDPSDASKATIVFEKVPKKAKVTGISYGSDEAFETKAISGKLGEGFKFFSTDISGTAGATSYTGIILKNNASYLQIDAKTVTIEGVDKTTTGINIEGDVTGVVSFDATEVQNVVWVCLSNDNGAIAVKASYDGGRALLKKIENTGEGTSTVLAVNGKEAEKETFSSVLYSDGTFIINESGFDRQTNLAVHGSISKEYDAWDGTDIKYDCPTGNPTDIPWYNDRASITTVCFGSTITPSTMKYWFKDHGSIITVDTRNLDMSKCETIKECFSGCSKLTTLDVSVWKNLQKLVNMDYAFNNCSSLEVLDVKPWACKKLQSMKGAFKMCSSLLELDFSTWDVGDSQNFQNLTETFRETLNMLKLDCTGIHPINVTTLNQTFYKCGNSAKGEVTIDISTWVINDLSGSSALQNTFSNCNRVKVLDCSGFNTKNCPDCQNCFRNCTALVTIYASDDFVLPNATEKTNYMFYNCTSLKGGNGTQFDASKADKTYARIDKAGQPGYFTEK